MNRAWEEVEAVLDAAIAGGVTPGASLCAAARARGEWRLTPLTRGALGWTDPSPVLEDTLYDLASITKPFTAWTLSLLAREGSIDLLAPLHDTLPAAKGSPVGARPLDALLSHRAGLVAWRPLYRAHAPSSAGSEATRRAMLDAIFGEAAAEAGEVYSDLGYILAGEALAACARSPIERCMSARDVLGALSFRCDAPARCAPTERCPWRQRVLRGEVHDENCFALGGAAGHAGLFGTATALCARGVAMLDAFRERAPWALTMLQRREGGTHRLGWDTRSEHGSSAGAMMGPRTFGHLGFTGTSLWCDPDAEVVIAVLTNRVHPSREGSGIRALRPSVHDAVMRALRP